MLQAMTVHEIGVGLMSEAMWNGDFDNFDPKQPYVFYRDRGTRDKDGKPERDILPTNEGVSILLTHFSDKAEGYDNLLSDLKSLMEEQGDSLVSQRDLRDLLKRYEED